MRRVRQLRDENRTRLRQKTSKETQDGSRGYERVQVLRHALHDGKDDARQGPNGHCSLSAVSIADVGDEEQGEEFSGGIDRIERAEEGALRLAEELAPLREGLEAVHHGSYEGEFML